MFTKTSLTKYSDLGLQGQPHSHPERRCREAQRPQRKGIASVAAPWYLTFRRDGKGQVTFRLDRMVARWLAMARLEAEEARKARRIILIAPFNRPDSCRRLSFFLFPRPFQLNFISRPMLERGRGDSTAH